jgi:hypothetical protein
MEGFAFVHAGVKSLGKCCKGKKPSDWKTLVMHMYVGIPALLLVEHREATFLVMLGRFEAGSGELLLRRVDPFPLSKFLRPSCHCHSSMRIAFPPEEGSLFLDSLFRTEPPMSTIGSLVLPVGGTKFVDFLKHTQEMLSTDLSAHFLSETPDPPNSVTTITRRICEDPRFSSSLPFPIMAEPPSVILSSTLPHSLIPIPSFACGFDSNTDRHLTYKMRPIFADVSLPREEPPGGRDTPAASVRMQLTPCSACSAKSFEANGLFPRIYVSLAKVAEIMRAWDDRTRAAHDMVLEALRSGCIFPHHTTSFAQPTTTTTSFAQPTTTTTSFAQPTTTFPLPTDVQFDRLLKVLQSYSNCFSAAVQYYNLRTSLCVVTERDGPALSAIELIGRMHKQLSDYRKWSRGQGSSISARVDVARLLGWAGAGKGAGLGFDLATSLKRDRDWTGCPLCESTENTSSVAGTKRFCHACEIEFCCKCDRIVQFENNHNTCSCSMDKSRCTALLKRAEKAGIPFIDVAE